MLGGSVLDELSTGLSAAELVDALADPHRCFQAYQLLLRLGPVASAACRDGLLHANAQVREYCCRVLGDRAGRGGRSSRLGQEEGVLVRAGRDGLPADEAAAAPAAPVLAARAGQGRPCAGLRSDPYQACAACEEAIAITRSAR